VIGQEGSVTGHEGVGNVGHESAGGSFDDAVENTPNTSRVIPTAMTPRARSAAAASPTSNAFAAASNAAAARSAPRVTDQSGRFSSAEERESSSLSKRPV
jgi:hypothetical protein